MYINSCKSKVITGDNHLTPIHFTNTCWLVCPLMMSTSTLTFLQLPTIKFREKQNVSLLTKTIIKVIYKIHYLQKKNN